MDPERKGYISLEEETTTSTPRRSDSPKEVVPSPPKVPQVPHQVPPQVPPRGIEHEEFCRDMNGVLLLRDHEERANFDQQDAFILGNPAASFDRSCGHNYDRKSDNPHAGYPVWKNIFLYILRVVGILKTTILFMSWSILETWLIIPRETGLPHWQEAVAGGKAVCR